MASLTVANGELAGQRIELSADNFVIGRSSSSSLALNEDAVSGQHCSLLRRGARYVLKDLDSTNGTRLNGSAIREALLKDGDRIGVGDAELIFEDDLVAPGRAASSPAFATRKSRRWRGIVIIAIVVALTIAASGWFLMKLFHS